MNFGLCLRSVFVSPAPSSGQQWNKSCSIEAQAPNTLALGSIVSGNVRLLWIFSMDGYNLANGVANSCLLSVEVVFCLPCLLIFCLRFVTLNVKDIYVIS